MSKYLQELDEVLSKKSRSIQMVNETNNSFINEEKTSKKIIKESIENKSIFQKIYNESKNEKWIPKMKKGALHKQLDIPEDKKIPVEVLKDKKKILSKKAEGDKKLSPKESKLSKRVNLALTLRKFK